jgi:hypothetical protein
MRFAKLLSTVTAALLVFVIGTGLADAQRGRKEAKAEPMFPNATREEPKAKPSQRMAKQLQRLVDLNEEEKTAEVIELAQKIVADKKAGPYERSFALQAQAFAEIDRDDYLAAIPCNSRWTRTACPTTPTTRSCSSSPRYS